MAQPTSLPDLSRPPSITQICGDIEAIVPNSSVVDWVHVLEELARMLRSHPPSSDSASSFPRLEIITKPICYATSATMDMTHATCRVSPELIELDKSHTLVGPAFQQQASTYTKSGCAGLVASPMGNITFEKSPQYRAFEAEAQLQELGVGTSAYETLKDECRTTWLESGGYYARWHCIAFFIYSNRLFLYDPSLDSPNSEVDIATIARIHQIPSTARVRDCILSLKANRPRITISHVYILKRPTSGLSTYYSFSFAATAHEQCIARSLAWLWGIVRDIIVDRQAQSQVPYYGGGAGGYGCIYAEHLFVDSRPEEVEDTLAIKGWKRLQK